MYTYQDKVGNILFSQNQNFYFSTISKVAYTYIGRYICRYNKGKMINLSDKNIKNQRKKNMYHTVLKLNRMRRYPTVQILLIGLNRLDNRVAESAFFL